MKGHITDLVSESVHEWEARVDENSSWGECSSAFLLLYEEVASIIGRRSTPGCEFPQDLLLGIHLLQLCTGHFCVLPAPLFLFTRKQINLYVIARSSTILYVECVENTPRSARLHTRTYEYEVPCSCEFAHGCTALTPCLHANRWHTLGVNARQSCSCKRKPLKAEVRCKPPSLFSERQLTQNKMECRIRKQYWECRRAHPSRIPRSSLSQQGCRLVLCQKRPQ